jgi:phage terminase small subunit
MSQNKSQQSQQQNRQHQQQEQQYNDHPIITYSNRIQKHLLQLTQELGYTQYISQDEKRKLLLIIHNLPPQAKQQLQHITTQLENNQTMNTKDYLTSYSQVSDWIYNNILQDAFRIRPLNTEKPHISNEEEQ